MLSVTLVSMLLAGVLACAQPSAPAARADQPAGRGAPTANGLAPMTVHSNLAQLMRGVFYPSSNVIFMAQATDPSTIKQAADPSTATDPLQSSYGGWEAVQNAGLTLAEGANLLLMPGRKCSNGRDMPLADPDWAKFVQALKDAGVAAAKAAQSKSLDNMLDAADTMTTACGDCHDKFREKPRGVADRCI
jgi:hypothetical protein